MPFRDRMRRAFQGRPSTSNSPTDSTSAAASSPSSGSDPSLQHIETIKTTELKPTDSADNSKTPELTHVDTKTSFISLRKITSRKPKAKKEDPWKDWPENIYKPHEMPPPRYKRPADPKHKQHLEAYSFENAFKGIGGKRRSRGSLYSPMGSRLPSRIGSVASRRSVARTEGPSRSASVVETTVQEDELEGGGVENVGISRQNTNTAAAPRSSSDDSRHRTAVPDLVFSSSLDTSSSDDNGDISPSPLATSKTVTQGDVSRAETTELGPPLSSSKSEPPMPGKPFSEEELARALHRTVIATGGDE